MSDRGKPAFIAADLVAQAEHDPETLVAIFITTSSKAARGGASRCATRSARCRQRIWRKVDLSRQWRILIARSRTGSSRLGQPDCAGTHHGRETDVSRWCRMPGQFLLVITRAQAAGDYASGPNHVLPTAGAARFRGGLSVMDFVKIITVQELSSKGLAAIAGPLLNLAETEGLQRPCRFHPREVPACLKPRESPFDS